MVCLRQATSFVVVTDEKKAREVAEFRRTRHKDSLAGDRNSRISMEIHVLPASVRKTFKVFNVILKTDVRGSLEAISGLSAEAQHR